MDVKNKVAMVTMEHVSSMEFYQKGEEVPTQIFTDLSFTAHQTEIWAITGSSAFEIRLVLELMANVRPYKDGKCILAQKGMMRKKRVILPHVYYVGSTNMLFSNMTVLEYLMFLSAKEEGNVAQRQKQILQQLLTFEMGYLSLSQIGLLTPMERSIVTLVAALYTKSEIVIWNLARLTYDERSERAIELICEEIKQQQRTMVFASLSSPLIERCATHIAPLYRGAFLFTGPVQEFIHTWDYLSATIEDERMEEIQAILVKNLPQYEYKAKEQVLEVWDFAQNDDTYEQICRCLQSEGYFPKALYRHSCCVENAWKEIRDQHDL